MAGKVSRRGLLFGGAGVAVVAAAGGAYVARGLWRESSVEAGVANVVKGLFGKDIASSDVLDEFAEYYIARQKEYIFFSRDKLLLAEPAVAQPVFAMVDKVRHQPANRDYAYWREDIGQAFLRNTTMPYREPGAAIKFEVRPSGIYTCNNPLARFDYDDA